LIRDIADGYVLVTERTFRSLTRTELDQVTFELERRQRDVRAEPTGLDDTSAIQQKNRKLQRLRSTHMMLQAFRAKMKK